MSVLRSPSPFCDSSETVEMGPKTRKDQNYPATLCVANKRLSKVSDTNGCLAISNEKTFTKVGVKLSFLFAVAKMHSGK